MKNLKIATSLFALLLTTGNTNAQYAIGGQVNSSNGGVSFAVLALKNTQLTAISDADGKFTFKNLKSGTYILQTKCFGYLDREDTLLVLQDLNFNPILTVSSKQLEEVVVDATRVDKKNGMAFNNLSSSDIEKQNLGQDVPYVLNTLPNVVINSDAGNGIGYTGIRIRGSDGTRINVTINGVPVNDAESQGTFLINMPDLLSSTNNIQVQRGVGASSNGAGAFGATINFQTNELKEKAYANLISTAGSFNTFRNTLAAGTGLLHGKFSLDARASKVTSDGYIDRASSDLSSYYLAGGYYGKKSVIKFINFNGWQKTYQAWYYVPETSIQTGNRTFNPAGEYTDANGMQQFYKNETDNYNQNNSQLHFIHQINKRMSFNATAHYTKGKGYYEQYRENEDLIAYSIKPLVTASNDTINTSDLIRRLWLDNDFIGGVFNFNYTANSKLAFTLGGGYNTYFGKHFTRVMWARVASDSEIDHEVGFNTANKNDGNIYLKTNYKVLSNLNVFVDLQARHIDYRFLGVDRDFNEVSQQASYLFFNPKAGLSYDLNTHLNAYASFAMANKEPNRNDFVESTVESRPKSEQLTDIEAGLKYSKKKLYLALNLYNMQYKDQLVLNGQINDVGAYTRVNVANSFRRGVELEANMELNKYFTVGANLSLSQNKILNFKEYIDSTDASWSVYTQHVNEYTETDISFSPNHVSSAMLIIKPVKNLELTFIQKNVGRQFLDNTSNNARSIKAYSLLDFRINYTIKTKLIPEINFMFAAYNLLNKMYETNGYSFSYYVDAALNTENYLAPAAPINFMGGVSFKF